MARFKGSACAAMLAFLLLGACAHMPGGGARLRVMTYNIAAGHGDLTAVAEVIRGADPDIVGLQEVDVRWDQRSRFEDQATRLGELLGMHVFFAPIYQLTVPGSRMREFGVAILTREPMVSRTNHQITRLSTQQGEPDPLPKPGFAEVSVRSAGRDVRVFNTHLDYRQDPEVRVTQVGEMLSLMAAGDSPALLLGDLNARPDAPELAPLFQRLEDAWPGGAGSGKTYPAAAPDRRIDYILTSDHFEVVRSEVLPSAASDHRALIADVILR